MCVWVRKGCDTWWGRGVFSPLPVYPFVLPVCLSFFFVSVAVYLCLSVCLSLSFSLNQHLLSHLSLHCLFSLPSYYLFRNSYLVPIISFLSSPSPSYHHLCKSYLTVCFPPPLLLPYHLPSFAISTVSSPFLFTSSFPSPSLPSLPSLLFLYLLSSSFPLVYHFFSSLLIFFPARM